MTDLSTIYSGKIMAYCPECDLQRMFIMIVTTKSTKLDCPVCHKTYFYRIVNIPKADQYGTMEDNGL